MDELFYLVAIVAVGLLVFSHMSMRSSIKRLIGLFGAKPVVFRSSQLQPLMELEFERARRLNYSFAIVIIKVEREFAWNKPADLLPASAAGKQAQETRPDTAPPGTINIFRSRKETAVKLRATDMAVYDEEKNRIVLLLPGTDKGDAEKMSEVIRSKLASELDQDVSYGCAVFPVDGLFMDDLVDQAEQQRAGRQDTPAAVGTE